MGFLVPIEDGNPATIEAMKKDTNWRFIIGIPIFLHVMTIATVSRLFTEPSIIDLLESD